MANPTQVPIDHLLGAFETGVLLLGLLFAGVLFGLRKYRKRVSAPGQFLMDWLGTWTIVELLLIGISSCNHAVLALVGVYPPDPVEVIQSNGLLLPISMIYCAGLVCKNTVLATWEALKEPSKEALTPKDGVL